MDLPLNRLRHHARPATRGARFLCDEKRVVLDIPRGQITLLAQCKSFVKPPDFTAFRMRQI
jgi:hypothetical protein